MLKRLLISSLFILLLLFTVIFQVFAKPGYTFAAETTQTFESQASAPTGPEVSPQQPGNVDPTPLPAITTEPAVPTTDPAPALTDTTSINTTPASPEITISQPNLTDNNQPPASLSSSADTTPPVITITRENPVSVNVGSVYSDAGAVASDNVDANVTVNTVSTVNTNLAGTYTVTYTAKDAAGNDAAAVTRTVNVIAVPLPLPAPTLASVNTTTSADRVDINPITPLNAGPVGGPPVDTTAPVITVIGTNPVSIPVGAVYTDAGASANDDIDGPLPVVTSASVNTSIAGTYEITYTATDAAGNIARASRAVIVSATSTIPGINTPPIIAPIPAQTVIVGTPVSFKVTATDTDGDPLTFSLGPNAPTSAKINPITGEFFWLPEGIGTVTFDILVSDGINKPVATGQLIENHDLGPDGRFATSDDTITGGMATWGVVKAQSRELLGIALDDLDALNLPLLAVDPYGNFIKGPNGFPQLVIPGPNPGDPPILIEGNPNAPVDASKALRSGHPFLADIAHSASPTNTRGVPLLPDSDTVVGLSEPGTYDNELLDAHFIAGDGRVNENIGLTAVHHLFHSEHNRLVDYIKEVILQTGDLSFLSQWLMPGSAPSTFPISPEERAALSWNGERLFQAAKYGTEMQYQHLVFEEFARKVQPQVNVFSGYHTDIDPAIVAEFAHTVYRFGHTMLTDTVARTNPDGSTNDIGLIQAFLNPLEFNASGTTPQQAAGAIVAGMTGQVGNEIDEFVTEALRSNLLGLPLDLATINIARGRDTGVPSLNNARRQFYQATGGDSALKPYESWVDFGLGIKHPESLINFIASYGTHPTITNATTASDKRAAATLLVLGGTDAPVDRLDFLNSTGAWANAPGAELATGLDDVDFWIGGLAEKQMPFGGLLGSTFNFVFETQMEKLQDGDRLYYLSRNAGLNFLTQLEQNSFAELAVRNTEGVNHLPHDIFSRPSLTIEASAINPANLTPDTIIMPDGTIRYTGIEHIVMGGTAGSDKLQASEGDDTIWGDEGDDRLEGGAGNDALNGGAGDDIITDLFGDDNIKGGGGNDVINAGQGIDLILGASGHDFIIGGRDPKEVFGGTGNDFIIAGDSADTVFGNEGDDWIEGGNQADLLQGDNGNPFQDSTTIGNDVIIGGGGDDDYDSESGDDIMLAGAGIERNEGMLGFDWVIYKLDPQPANADMFFTGLLPPSVDALRDRFDMVEGFSGGSLNDTLKGDNLTTVDLSKVDATSGQNNVLNNATQIALIDGLQSLLGESITSFSGGNILLGGDGSDTLEGRGGDDILDGDAWLNVRLSVRDASNPAIEIQRADSMTELQGAMFAGIIKPNQILIVREILTPSTIDDDIDTAVFSGNLTDYTISLPDTQGQITVTDNRPLNGGGGSTNDGTDIIRNIERLQFADQTIDLTKGLNKVFAPTLSGVFVLPSPDEPLSDGGFTLAKSDLEFILDQIKIAEAHTTGTPLGTLIPKETLPWGLRTIDGSFNNIVPGQSDFGAADKVFPRLTEPVFNQAETVTIDLDGPGPLTVDSPTSYTQTSGFVFDSEPRLISNLIVDQTSNNPAAVAAAGAGAILDPATNTLFIPNVAPDMGLSAPYNSWFTLFGQFFDHGLDLVNKGGSGTVFIPLAPDDPLFNPLSRNNFMVLTRATNQPGPDGVLGTTDDIHEHINQTSPFVDQNQTYTSHPSHQVFLRAYKFSVPNTTQTALATITITPVPDTTAPVIALLGDNPLEIIIGSDYTEAGATASDNIDQTVTVNIVNAVNTNVLGTYTVTYTATDAAGNRTSVTRTVNVIPVPDKTPPVITLLGNSSMTLTANSSYTDAGATAADDFDGDLTANIIVSGLPLNTAIPGIYTITYTVKDAAGNITAISRVITVIEVPPASTPFNVTISQTAAGIDIKWADSNSNEAQFRVSRRVGITGNFTQIGTTSANITTFTDTSAPIGIVFYQIEACNLAGCSAVSAPTRVLVTRRVVAPPVPAPAALRAVTNLRAVNALGGVTLSWRDKNTTETEFKVERSTSTLGGFTQIGTVGADSTTFIDPTPPLGRVQYRIIACNLAGCSPASNLAVLFRR